MDAKTLLLNNLSDRLKSIKIKRKSRWWKFVPFTGRDRFSLTFGETIYLTPKKYDDWKSGNPKSSTIALIAHETVHVSQWRREAHFKQEYIKSRRARLIYEAEAYARQAYIRVKLDKHGRDRDFFVTRYTKILRSKTYLLLMSFETIYQAIDRKYKELLFLYEPEKNLLCSSG